MNDCKHQQEWLKKKGQVEEADIALSGLEETKVLMAFNEDDTSQSKGWIFESVVWFMYVPKRSCSTL